MNTHTIIDIPVYPSIGEYLRDNEVLEWEGVPHHTIPRNWLAKGLSYDTATQHVDLSRIVITVMVLLGYYFYLQHNWVALVLDILIGHTIVFAPDVLQYLRMKNTRYAFSQQRVFFQLWRWGKTYIQIIDFKEIAQITYQEYADGSGVIHFMPVSSFDFYTHDFGGGGKRFYPTFELVPDVVKLQKRLEELRLAGGGNTNYCLGYSFQ